MSLTDVKIRVLKAADRPYKATDDRGLYLEVSPSGTKLWRFRYRYLGKDKRIALGCYPKVGLAEARRKRDDVKSKLYEGVDPGAERNRAKLLAIHKGATRSAIWLGSMLLRWSPKVWRLRLRRRRRRTGFSSS